VERSVVDLFSAPPAAGDQHDCPTRRCDSTRSGAWRQVFRSRDEQHEHRRSLMVTTKDTRFTELSEECSTFRQETHSDALRGITKTSVTIALVAWAMLLSHPARAGDSSIVICAQSRVTMPSAEQHRSWLASDSRYGPEISSKFAREARNQGDNYIQYQIIYLPEYPGGSGWFDITGLTGLREARRRPVKEWTCDNNESYPIVLLVGVEAKAIREDTLYVSPKRGLYTLISLRDLSKSGKPTMVRLFNSNKLICTDLRTSAKFDEEGSSSEIACSHPAPYFEKRSKPKRR
jgi:hypothetical protein